MCWLLLGVCAAVALYMLYKHLQKPDDGPGDDPPGPPPYNLRTRPTVPALDTNIYIRY